MNLRKILSAVSFTLLYIYSATAQNVLNCVDQSRMEAWADSVMATLTPEERLGQLISQSYDLSQPVEKNLAAIKSDIEKYHIGGFFFVQFNNLEAVEKIAACAQKNSKVPVMQAADCEWGLTMRIKDAVHYPRNMALGCINHENREGGDNKRNSLLYEYGFTMGKQCRAMGISVAFAPVLDINSNPKNPIINNRSFGDNKLSVASAGLSYSAGLEDAGVLAVAKHFPGHGDTDKDSHEVLPLLSHDKERMEQFEMFPFEQFSKAGFGGMMVAHLEVPSLEKTKGMPSSASHKIVTEQLRDRIGFNGLTFTDGLAMQGAQKYPSICVKALNAGIDVLLQPTPMASQWADLKAALKDGRLSQDLVDQKCKRVLMYKYALASGVMPDRKTIDTEAATTLSKRLYQESLVLLKNDKPLAGSVVIPVSNAKQATINQVNQKIKAAGRKPVTLVFYTTPYNLSSYKTQISKAANVILAHEDYSFAREAVQKVIDGKANIDGQLCVELPGLFKLNDGIKLLQTAVPATNNASDNISSSLAAQDKSRTEEHEVKTTVSKLQETDNKKLSEIDRIVADAIAKGAFPGCQVLVMKDNEIVFNKAFGYFDSSKKQKVTLESLYDLASLTKAAGTVPALMCAIDDYGISVNDKMSKYISALKGTDKSNLTIRQALFHETGLRSSYSFYGMTIDSASVNGRLYMGKRTGDYTVQYDATSWFHKGLKWNPAYISRQKDATHSLQIADGMFISPDFQNEMLAKIIELPLKNTGRYRYSDLNFVLLRHIIESQTKMPIDKYLEKKLFAPLGLTHTCYTPRQKSNIDLSQVVPTEKDNALRRQVIHGFVHDETAAWSGGVEGNAGLFSNATDLAKLLQVLLNNGKAGEKQLIKENTVKLFTTAKAARTRRGLGFDKPDMANPDKSPCANEAPRTVFGHTGFTGTCFWVDPTNKIIYIFLCNRISPTRTNNLLMKDNIRTRIQSAIYKALL